MTSEQIRQAMLEQMGITPWFARASLPGAAPAHPQTRRALREAVRSRDETGREGSGARVVPAGTGAETNARAGTIAQPGSMDSQAPERTSTLQRLLQNTPAAPAAGTARTVPDAASEPPRSVDKAPRSAAKAPVAPVAAQVPTPEAVNFAFCWIDLDEHLAVLAELPPNSRRLSREARQMLANMTAALNPRYRGVTLREHNFHWPFVVAPHLPADAQAAQQAVDGFISRRLQERKVSHVLVLSESMPFYLATGLSDGPAVLHQHTRHGFRLLHTHALYAMLSDGALKRSAWQVMQTLISALQNTSDGI